jgi:hypothetical protein
VRLRLLQECCWLAAVQVLAALLPVSPQQLQHTRQGRQTQLGCCLLLLLALVLAQQHQQ